mmetsp:Transcript_41348/g.60467  ORF Transcript_41348/g.60467 Transcript_41348/m.60467 type:complete len:82 (+) Transcript_41348:1804-2049(+)
MNNRSIETKQANTLLHGNNFFEIQNYWGGINTHPRLISTAGSKFHSPTFGCGKRDHMFQCTQPTESSGKGLILEQTRVLSD